MADRQPQPRASELRSRSSLAEGLEHGAQVLGLDPDPGIDHVEAKAPRRTRFDLEPDLAMWRELHGVAEQVEEDLPQVPPIEDDPRRHAGIDVRDEGEALPLRPLLDDVAEIDRHLAQIARRRLDVHPAGLDLREIEHVVDEVEEVRSAGADGVERIALVGAERAIALEELRVADDAVERRAQLVAHVGEELALGARRGLG